MEWLGEPGGATGTSLLTTHTEAAGGTLAGGNTATLTVLGLLAARCRCEVAKDAVLHRRKCKHLSCDLS